MKVLQESKDPHNPRLVQSRAALAFRQGGLGLTGPTSILPAASAASISESLMCIYNRKTWDHWLPTVAEDLDTLPTMLHYNHSVAVLKAVYVPPPSHDGPVPDLEKGIHDLFEEEPWVGSDVKLRDNLAEVLCDTALRAEFPPEDIPHQKQLSNRLHLSMYMRMVRSKSVPTLHKCMTHQGANAGVRALVNSVPLTRSIKQTGMENPVALSFYAQILALRQPMLRGTKVPDANMRLVPQGNAHRANPNHRGGQHQVVDEWGINACNNMALIERHQAGAVAYQAISNHAGLTTFPEPFIRSTNHYGLDLPPTKNDSTHPLWAPLAKTSARRADWAFIDNEGKTVFVDITYTNPLKLKGGKPFFDTKAVSNARKEKMRSYGPILKHINDGLHPSLRPNMVRFIPIVVTPTGAIDSDGRALLAELVNYEYDPRHPFSQEFRDWYAGLRLVSLRTNVHRTRQIRAFLTNRMPSKPALVDG